MNTVLLSASAQAVVASDPLMPLLTQNIIVGLIIVALLGFFGRSIQEVRTPLESD